MDVNINANVMGAEMVMVYHGMDPIDRSVDRSVGARQFSVRRCFWLSPILLAWRKAKRKGGASGLGGKRENLEILERFHLSPSLSPLSGTARGE
jgi:hypothetical protein